MLAVSPLRHSPARVFSVMAKLRDMNSGHEESVTTRNFGRRVLKRYHLLLMHTFLQCTPQERTGKLGNQLLPPNDHKGDIEETMQQMRSVCFTRQYPFVSPHSLLPEDVFTHAKRELHVLMQLVENKSSRLSVCSRVCTCLTQADLHIQIEARTNLYSDKAPCEVHTGS